MEPSRDIVEFKSELFSGMREDLRGPGRTYWEALVTFTIPTLK